MRRRKDFYQEEEEGDSRGIGRMTFEMRRKLQEEDDEGVTRGGGWTFDRRSRSKELS